MLKSKIMNDAVVLASINMELRPCRYVQRRQLVIKHLEAGRRHQEEEKPVWA
jgi:hypothetical protein